MIQETHQLTHGTLKITYENLSTEQLFEIASRKNPKRAFLFVSTVLGKHIPTRPDQARKTHKLLAEQFYKAVSPKGRKNIHVIGMAETATALGEGIYEVLKPMYAGYAGTVTYQHTTRIHTAQPQITFSEPHSHAPDQMLCLPPKDITHLVIADDEMTTGNTLINLVRAVSQKQTELSEIHVMSLLDWTDHEEIRHQLEGLKVYFHSLARGTYQFNATSTPTVLPQGVKGTQHFKFPVGVREGRGRKPLVFENLKISGKWRRVLVIGQGEDHHHALLTAEHIEKSLREILPPSVHRDIEVCFSATTKSPIEQGGPIQHVLSFQGHIDPQETMYLYNVRRKDWDAVILMHTTAHDLSPQLIKQLKPCITFNSTCGYAKKHE